MKGHSVCVCSGSQGPEGHVTSMGGGPFRAHCTPPSQRLYNNPHCNFQLGYFQPYAEGMLEESPRVFRNPAGHVKLKTEFIINIRE